MRQIHDGGQFLKEPFRCLGEHLIAFPYNRWSDDNFRAQGEKAQPAVSACIDELVQANRIAEPLFDHQGGIEDQVVGSGHVQTGYGGFEKVGPLEQRLPTENAQTTTQAGDIVLYQGDQIVLFYGSNSWSYTRLGKIDDLTGWAEALGGGDLSVTFSLQKP